MSALRTAIEGFLTAAGYRVVGYAPRGVMAERAAASGGLERAAVWTMTPDAAGTYDEAGLAAEIDQGLGSVSDIATRLLVVPTLAGLSVPFKDRLGALGIGIRVPVQFFDTPYKADADQGFGPGSAGDARSVFADFVAETAESTRTRVPQPFVAMSDLGAVAGGFASGPDLLAHLQTELAAPPATPRLTIVLGHAGAGKSVLFSALFSALHQKFAADKRAQRDGTRPLLFLPGHIRDRQVSTLDGLLDAVAGTEAAAATNPALMRWLVEAGRTAWMFDGLDEFFAGEGDFVAALDAMLSGNGHAQILICTRDSLITSSEPLRTLIDRHLPLGHIRLYELSRWDRPTQRVMAHVKLAGAAPAQGATDPPLVQTFLDGLDRSEALAELATLPFYCGLMLDMLKAGHGSASSEFDLLSHAVDSMIDREASKLESGEYGFGWDVYSGADTFMSAADMVESLGSGRFADAVERERLLAIFHDIGRARFIELIEDIAHVLRTSEAHPNESRGLHIEDIEMLGRASLDVGLLPDLEPRVLLALMQLCFFAPGRDKGHVRFAHEIIADFMAARCAVRMLRARSDTPDAVSQAVGSRAGIERSVFLRTIVHELAADAEIVDLVRAHVESGRIRPQSLAGARALAEALQRGAA